MVGYRSGALAAIKGNHPVSPEVNLSAGHGALTEANYRVVYLLTIINSEQLIEAGWRKDIDGIVEVARDAMAQTMKECID